MPENDHESDENRQPVEQMGTRVTAYVVCRLGPGVVSGSKRRYRLRRPRGMTEPEPTEADRGIPDRDEQG